MPAPRATPTDLHGLLDDALALYRGLFSDVQIRTRFASTLPKVSADPEQIRRVIINIVDNAIEAVQRRGAIDIETQHDAGNSLVRIVVADDGRTSRPPSATSCFCRATPRSSGAVASVSRSSGASSPSTAATSTSATTCHAARGSQSSCRC